MIGKTKAPRSKPVTRDVDIRKVLLANLEVKYSDSSHDLIVEEFGCKTARADVAVINGFLHAEPDSTLGVGRTELRMKLLPVGAR